MANQEGLAHLPLVLAVLDGWGCSESAYGNAIAAAHAPHWRALLERYPWTTLEASGEAVGLPKGIMGNSEVGHMNLGSGRVVPQGVVVIDADVRSGAFLTNATLQACIAHVKRSGGTLHLLGLLSDGQVHSSIAHLFALIDAAGAANAPFVIHCFLDGRDTPPRSALKYIEALEAKLMSSDGTGTIASVCGRYYAMDRDKRWERTQHAYDMLAGGIARYRAANAADAVRDAYARDESDEFVLPAIVGPVRSIGDGDACIFFNFRPDRARALTLAFNCDASVPFPTKAYSDFVWATMTKYDESYPNAVLFGPRPQFDTFGEIVARAGLKQLRLAETEKYAHVTYFFNGGREEQFPGEDRKLIPSDRSVATYDLAPAMRAREITDYAVGCIEQRRYDVIIMNYANADMVGHTGKWEPTVESVQILDACLARLEDAVSTAGGLLVITADHGNAEEKLDKDGNPLTAHTVNPVPLVLAGANVHGKLLDGGRLGDVAPTLLALLGLPVPDAMNGRNLLRDACERCLNAFESQRLRRACSHGCSFCEACSDTMGGICPNCGGALV
ncbi:MAG: 2,3-bisphosphoglycerate-independent phosphoglycerate mutase [Candidatus Eremiobacteraeota bacterium]|nr:2,3-bisphosphoglycerate-independent phosphoglycerate mutase [Candidatus Eremiobacteraeota bacterium]